MTFGGWFGQTVNNIVGAPVIGSTSDVVKVALVVASVEVPGLTAVVGAQTATAIGLADVGLSTTALAAIGTGEIMAAASLASGDKLSKAIQVGATAGLGNYAASVVSNYAKNLTTDSTPGISAAPTAMTKAEQIGLRGVASGIQSGTNAAISGGKFGKGFEYGLAGGIAQQGVQQTLGNTFSPRTTSALGKGTYDVAGSLATGAPAKYALAKGLSSGLADYYFYPDKGSTATDQALGSIGKQFASTALMDLLYKPSGSTATGTAGGETTGSAPSGGTQLASLQPGGSTVGSAALGQALNIGDAGAPIFGKTSQDKSKPSGWNIESLRYMGNA